MDITIVLSPTALRAPLFKPSSHKSYRKNHPDEDADLSGRFRFCRQRDLCLLNKASIAVGLNPSGDGHFLIGDVAPEDVNAEDTVFLVVEIEDELKQVYDPEGSLSAGSEFLVASLVIDGLTQRKIVGLDQLNNAQSKEQLRGLFEDDIRRLIGDVYQETKAPAAAQVSLFKVTEHDKTPKPGLKYLLQGPLWDRREACLRLQRLQARIIKEHKASGGQNVAEHALKLVKWQAATLAEWKKTIGALE